MKNRELWHRFLAVLLSACAPSLAGKDNCRTDADCAPGRICAAGRCGVPNPTMSNDEPDGGVSSPSPDADANDAFDGSGGVADVSAEGPAGALSDARSEPSADAVSAEPADAVSEALRDVVDEGNPAEGGDACDPSGACPCDATTCPYGCCDANHVCQTSTADSCGKGGAQCQPCLVGQRCSDAGQCVCDGTSCAGCCDEHRACQPTSDHACGTNGATCQECAPGLECINGSCHCDSTSCPDGCCDFETCVPYTSQSDTLCGTAGNACAVCPTGISCDTRGRGGICFGCGPQVPIPERTTMPFTPMAGDAFGTHIALANGTLIATAPGAFGGMGAVFSFAGSRTSFTPNGALGLLQGPATGVAVSGDTAVVTALPNDVRTASIFQRTGANWFAEATSISPPTDPSFPFPWPIALDGDVLVAGGSVSASVYSIADGTLQATLVSPDDLRSVANNDQFGTRVAVSGSTILVLGRPLDGSGQVATIGYVFVRKGSGWDFQAKLVPSDLVANNDPHFQASVAIDGDMAVIATSEGIYIFGRSGTTWTELQKVPSPNPNLGASLAFRGNLMVVGAPSPTGGFGAAYLFGRSNQTWISGPTLTSGAFIPADGFGVSVAVDSGTVLVGAPTVRPGTPPAFDLATGTIYLYYCYP